MQHTRALDDYLKKASERKEDKIDANAPGSKATDAFDLKFKIKSSTMTLLPNTENRKIINAKTLFYNINLWK